jgi:hypothetical protein
VPAGHLLKREHDPALARRGRLELRAVRVRCQLKR